MAADVTSSALAGAAAAAAPAAISGMPPTDVLVWALIGGIASVWLDRKTEVVVSAKWLMAAVVQIFLSTAAGIAASAAVLAVSAAHPWLSTAGQLPRWVTAVTVAALIFRVGPPVFRAFMSRLNGKGGSDVA